MLSLRLYEEGSLWSYSGSWLKNNRKLKLKDNLKYRNKY